jgi:carbohydrate kinase (thermoresistant glucokinase family)
VADASNEARQRRRFAVSQAGLNAQDVAVVPALDITRSVVVMGVSACGKSTVGRLLAEARAMEYLDGDDFHPPQNVARMAAGQALSDDDRQGWLLALSERLARAQGKGVVLSCSALKRAYRDVLRRGAPHLLLVYLHGSRALLAERIAARTGHYMPASLLDSQLATLQPPQADEAALSFDVIDSPQQIVAAILHSGALAMPEFHKTVLLTDSDGRARFREERIAFSEGTPQAMLSPLFDSGGYQLRHSPVGFRSSFHCTGTPQWVFILSGQMEIGLQDGSWRLFKAGEHFFSADTLPEGAAFDASVHGHCSRQVGDQPLVTLFVRG